LHFLVYATKSKRLPQPLETQNKSIILLFFAFLGVILMEKKPCKHTRKQQGL